MRKVDPSSGVNCSMYNVGSVLTVPEDAHLTPSVLVASLRDPRNVFHHPETCG